MVQAINGALKRYMSRGYDRVRTVGLDRERTKSNSALEKFTNNWSNYGVSIVSDGWTNVKGKPLINILGVSASGAVFLSTRDYSDCYKPSINIAQPLLETIQTIGHTMPFKSSEIIFLIVRQQEQSLRIR